MADIYEKLRTRLDDLATGFPSTEDKMEIRILKKLFTEDEAEFFLELSPLPESPADTAKRLGLDPDQTATQMERMAKKGLLFRSRKNDSVKYAAVPFIVGIYEFQVDKLNKEIAHDMNEYFEKSLGRTLQSFKTPVMRTIPILKDLVVKWPIAPYEDVLKILEQHEIIAIAPCICRTLMKMVDKGCDKPIETCFMFGSHAHYYVENGMGRYIDLAEAKKIIKRNEEAGLVMQPFNSQRMGGMCSCCGDCCGMLRSLKMQPNPAKAVQSNYYARVNPEECIGCETCLDRCQMEAIEVVGEKAVIDLGRCIGCGLCVTTCPTGAMQLIKKPEDQQYEPPKIGAETYIRIAMERHKDMMPKN
ncbi:MAG: 4Fe-4S binding protein [Deltaproteobacteria bacterium]|nr:4Fe-4S binding protein [Deltaproteobacteria bacterium]